MKNKDQINIHVGQMLSDFCEDQGMSMKAIGKNLGLEGSTIIYHQKQPLLNTGIILKYSEFFKHNFFSDLASKLPKEYTSNAPQAEEELAIIASLKEELQALKDDFKIVKAERDLLKEVMRGR